MGPADAGGQENGPRDEGSRAVGALQEGANAELGADAQTSGGQATAGEMNGEGANDDDANGGHGIGFATPRNEANEATAANGPRRDDHRGGSPAYRRELPMSDGEANAPGAPQPLRRSARQTPRAGASAVTRTCPRMEPTRAAGPRSGGGSDQRTLAEQQARSRQGVQEEADREQDRSPRCNRGQERQGNPLANAQDAPLAHEEPTTPISQAQQAEPVAAMPRSGRGSTRGRGGRRGARGGQRSAGQAGRGPPCQLPSPIWLGEPAERVTRHSFAKRGARGGTPAQAGRNRDINTEGSGDDYIPGGMLCAGGSGGGMLGAGGSSGGMLCAFRSGGGVLGAGGSSGRMLCAGGSGGGVLGAAGSGGGMLGAARSGGGMLVGSQSFCSDFVRSTLTDAAAPLGSLASIHPQHALLLRSRCISRRVGYLLGTTPANVLPLSEWHTWCAELLNTALTAASIQPPRRQAEFNFLLRQATLPVALGGLGLTNPTTEAAPAYLASTTEALRLLRSLDLPATAPLGADSNALQPSAAHSVTIQDMEGRLPPLALQNLREEQQTPSQDQLQRALSQEVHAAKADALREESRAIHQLAPLVLEAAADLISGRWRSNRHARGRVCRRKRTGSKIALRGAIAAKSAKEIHWPTLKTLHWHTRSRQRRSPKRNRRNLWQLCRGADGEARGGEAGDEERAEGRGAQAKREGDRPASCRAQSGWGSRRNESRATHSPSGGRGEEHQHKRGETGISTQRGVETIIYRQI
ncbi:unnamed protein product [Closterium sp. NIES-64]|nr:unnamed protein product [Closterium sp. NIES-64]